MPLVREDGSRIIDPPSIKAEAAGHFQNLLNAGSSYLGKEALASYITKRIPESLLAPLTLVVSDNEVKEATFSIHPSKALGPYVFNDFFFR